MQIRRLPLELAALVLVVAGSIPALAAASYKVTLPSDVLVGGTKLKAGEYTVTVQDKQAIFKRGKQTIQIPVDVEKSDHKFSDTTFEMTGDSVRVIDLRGTDTMLVFGPQQ